jgi:septal ring factor EnvC (AmiA/AmiB activator)
MHRVLLASILVLGWTLASAGGALGSSAADSLVTYTNQLKQQEKELESLRNRIRTLRKDDSQLAQEEVGTVKQLQILEKEVALTEELLRRLQTKQTHVEAQLEGIRTEHAEAQDLLEVRRDQLGRTLRAMYTRGASNAAQVMLRTTSLRDALTRVKYLNLVARNNERLLRDIRVQEVSLAAANAELTERLAEVAATTAEAMRERKNLEDSRHMRQSALRKVRNKRGEYHKSLESLAESEKQVQGLVEALERQRARALAEGGAQEFPDVGFAALRGRMPWPVVGKVKTRFGRQRHPEYGTITMNSGIDIEAKFGEPVRSVARGRVEYVSWLDGYGRTLIINHGGGFYTVYAHLSEVRVGEAQTVVPGQVIGTAGDSGSLDGPKLHFEIRSGQNAGSVDPMKWLVR